MKEAITTARANRGLFYLSRGNKNGGGTKTPMRLATRKSEHPDFFLADPRDVASG